MTIHPQPRIGVVILNWKRPVEILDCLASVQRQTYSGIDVVVVDNASDNGSVDRIHQQFPEVSVIENGRNLGFAGGCNVGIRAVLDAGAEYVFLLNDDAEVAPDLLQTLVNTADAHPEVGILGPKICYFDRPDVIWSGGGAIDAFGEPSHLAVDKLEDVSEEGVVEVDYVTGCGFLIRRSVIERIGLLDERFFAYFEEAEWCARARAAGFRVAYVPHARMWHKVEMESRTMSPLYLYLMTRNRLLYLACGRAPYGARARALLDLLKTAAGWLLKPRQRAMRPYVKPLVRGIVDYYLGRFGPPPQFVHA